MSQQQPLNPQYKKSGVSTPQNGALANYTLPGVISYLTSEFTSLERFKIMTNLEKSEMKYRIQQLTSEVNSLRFVNEKQALRIEQLEQKLAAVEDPPKPSESSAESGSQPHTESESKESANGKNPKLKRKVPDDIQPHESSSASPKERQKASSEDAKEEKTAQGADIPYIDLEILRNSRKTLNSSIREIISLLKPPSGMDYMTNDLDTGSHVAFDELLDDSDNFKFKTDHKDYDKPKEGLFARYTLGSSDVLQSQSISFDNDVKRSAENPVSDIETGDEEDASKLPVESDTETVIVDESDTSGILGMSSEQKTAPVL